ALVSSSISGPGHSRMRRCASMCKNCGSTRETLTRRPLDSTRGRSLFTKCVRKRLAENPMKPVARPKGLRRDISQSICHSEKTRLRTLRAVA
ncbi:hypothetical protein LTR16_006822, partial [Cryomyces antarcticus]